MLLILLPNIAIKGPSTNRFRPATWNCSAMGGGGDREVTRNPRLQNIWDKNWLYKKMECK